VVRGQSVVREVQSIAPGNKWKYKQTVKQHFKNT